MKKKLDHIQMIFLVSRGRSGSTLLQSILDAHPNICAPIESKFVLHLQTKYGSVNNWSEKVIKSFIKDIYTNRKFRLFWNITPIELRDKFSQYEITHFRDACKVIYLCHHSFFEKGDIKVIVDKNPLHSRFSAMLLNIFPNSKFIHLMRDPRAVTYSHIKSLNQKNAANIAYEWRLLNEKIETTKNNHPSLFYSIQYESFTKNPEVEAKKMFHFIGLNFFPELLDANLTIKQKYKSSTFLALNQHANVSNPISTSNIKSWEDHLSENEVVLINAICHPLMDKYGYQYKPPLYSLYQSFKISIARIRSNHRNWVLQTLFSAPFNCRVFLYGLVSLIKDKQYRS